MSGCDDCGERANELCLDCLHKRITQEVRVLDAQVDLHKAILEALLLAHPKLANEFLTIKGELR